LLVEKETNMTLRLGDGEELGLEMGDVNWADDLADIGALRRPGRGQRMPARRAGQQATQRLPMRRLNPQIPGAPAIGLRLQPLGLSVVSFTATSGTQLPASTQPQRPFKGKRLVVDVARTGVTATGLITVAQFTVGSTNQLVSFNPIGTSAFAANAFDTNMELSACAAALTVTVGYALSVAPTAPDRIDIATTLFGETIG
jgi:hypothetical protein